MKTTETKHIEAVIRTSEIFVMHGDATSDVWVPAAPNSDEQLIGEDGLPHDVHMIMIAKTATAYHRLFAGKTFPNAVKLVIRDWGNEVLTRPDGSVDVVVHKVCFEGGEPFPAPTLEALATECKTIDGFYNAVHAFRDTQTSAGSDTDENAW